MHGIYNNNILGWVFKFGAWFLKFIFFQHKKIKYEIKGVLLKIKQTIDLYSMPCHADFSLLIGSLQMCILLVGAANTTQGHPVSNFFQQSVLSKFLPQNIRVLL